MQHPARIENIVCSGSFNRELDLRKLSDSDCRIEYGKNRYSGAYIKFITTPSPHCTASTTYFLCGQVG